MSDFKAVPYEFDRDQEVIDLLHRVFSPWTGDQAYFNWKYKGFKPGACAFPNAWIIEDNRKIIAFNGYIPRLIRSKGKDYWAVQSFDTVTDPDYRGKGLFGILQNQAYEKMRQYKISWVYGWTSDIGFKVFTKKMGWNVWGKQQFLMKPLDTATFVRSKISYPLIASMISPMLNLWNRITKPSVSNQYKINQTENLPDSASGLLGKYNTTFTMAAQKSVEYVNWRASNPNDRLEFFTLQNIDGSFAGYAAFTIRGNSLDVDDIVVDNKDALKSLLAAIEDHARRIDSAMVKFRVNVNHPWTGVFKRAGYFWSHTQFALLGKKLMDDGFQPQTENLHWTFFDRNE